jgi:vacuolar-type H+-ATPase subunit F/Vma7
MALVCYIGDEVTAAGFRLAGTSVIVPVPGQETAALATARTDAAVVLIDAAVAARISSRDLVLARSAIVPLVLIVPDLHGEIAMPDVAAQLRARLGLEDAR